ncbi:MAG: transglutaminase N-terminal domain-containing protein [Candidatus Methylacidiphilales bacterium]|nr:transglutaminase family protein [Candidatus Methylacidiphilales bacterium]
MKIKIEHRTTYRYTEPVVFGQHRVIVRPREGHDIHIESSILKITPAHTTYWIRDVNGNCIALVDFNEPASELEFYSELVLNHYDSNPLDFRIEPSAVQYPFIYDPEIQPELAAYTHLIYPKDAAALRAWISQFHQTGTVVNTVEMLQNMTAHIFNNFMYTRRDEAGVQSPGQTLQLGSGSCRDFATLFMEACRCWGLAARFVSGYMLCPAAEMGGASTHAWAEVYLPGAGWKGFDPTSNLLTGSEYVPVAVSRNPEGAMPISGSFTGLTGSSMGIIVDVRVTRLDGQLVEPAPGPTPQPCPLETVPPVPVAVPIAGTGPLPENNLAPAPDNKVNDNVNFNESASNNDKAPVAAPEPLPVAA